MIPLTSLTGEYIEERKADREDTDGASSYMRRCFNYTAVECSVSLQTTFAEGQYKTLVTIQPTSVLRQKMTSIAYGPGYKT